MKNLEQLIIPDFLRERVIGRPCACGSDVKVVDQLSYVDWIVCLFCLNTFVYFS